MIETTTAINLETQEPVEIETEYITKTPSEGWLSGYNLCLPKEYVEAGGDVGYLTKGDVLDRHNYLSLLPFLRKDSTVIDVGAHMGSISMLLSRGLHEIGGGKLISIEASPQNHVCAKHNIMENLPSNVTAKVINGICCSTAQEKEYFPVHDKEPFRREDGSVWGSAKITGQYSYGVEKNLDRTLFYEVMKFRLDDLNLQNVSAIKIDTEGSDIDVLIGATETIKRSYPAIVFEDRSPDHHKYFTALASHQRRHPLDKSWMSMLNQHLTTPGGPLRFLPPGWQIRPVRKWSVYDWLLFWPTEGR